LFHPIPPLTLHFTIIFSWVANERGVIFLDQLNLDFFISQGPWAALFVSLLFWVLKENSKREERLITCLDELSSKYDTIARDITEIKDEIKRK
jgi:hypothetical protein